MQDNKLPCTLLGELGTTNKKCTQILLNLCKKVKRERVINWQVTKLGRKKVSVSPRMTQNRMVRNAPSHVKQ